MSEDQTNTHDESQEEEFQTEVKTDVSYEGEGTVHGVLTVQQGDRRADFKIGHIDGTYAAGDDYYHKGELFYSTGFTMLPENAPSGEYRDDTFKELLEADVSVKDGRLVDERVYDAEGVDTTEWATSRLEAEYPNELLEAWEYAKSKHDDGELE
jgi:hypothetical protein